MIVATPLDIPNFEPDNWQLFWQLWEDNATPLVKRSMNVNTSEAPVNSNDAWIGFDIFKHGHSITHWEANYLDVSTSLPNFYTSLMSLPIKNIHRIRLISNIMPIPAHTDDNLDRWSVRYFLYNENTKPVWYFTPPGLENKSNRTYFSTPSNTNWFAYNDKYCWHGCEYDFEHKKILLQIYYNGNQKDLVEDNIEKYKDYTIEL